MSGADPTEHVFWLASRAVGVVAMILLSASVALGLLLSGRTIRRPGAPAWLKHLHEATALTALVAIVAHGALLIGDDFLRPGVAGVVLPFHLAGQPVWTGVGVVAGWLAVLLGLSFYARRRIGVGVWRWLHRWTLAAYLLALAHALGSGSDSGSWWMLAVIGACVAPVIFALTLRLLPGPPAAGRVSSPAVG